MKKLFGLALAGVSALTLSSCGGNNSAIVVDVLNDLTEQEVYNLEADISFWHAFTEGGEHEAALNNLIEDFNETYPNINITHTYQGKYPDLRNSTIKSLSAGNNPTMVIAYTDHTASYIDSNAVLPLDEYINRETFGISQEELDDFIPGYLGEGRIYDEAGTYYALPFNKSTEVLYVNETLLDKYNFEFKGDPTWGEIEELSRLANADNKVGLLYDSVQNAFITLAEQYGAPYTSVSEPHYLFDDPKTEDAITYFTDKAKTTGTFSSNSMTNTHPMYATPAYWSTNDRGPVFFNNENVVMVIGSTSGANLYGAGAGVEGIELGVYPMPQYDSDNPAAIQQGTNINILASNTTNEERLAAWLFTQYMVMGDGNAQFAASSGYLPVSNAAYNSDIYQDFLDTNSQRAIVSKVGYAQRDAYFMSPTFVGSDKARQEVGQIINDVAYTGKSYQDAAKAAIDELNA